MKRSNVLLVLSLLVLTGCQSTPSSSSEPSSDSSSTSKEPVDFASKFNGFKENLQLTGTLSYKFYNLDEATGEYSPSTGEPVTTQLNVAFTNEGYVLSYEGNFDENFTETLFKSSDNTVELRQINNNNELEITRPKDKDGNEYDFAPYTNPFGKVSNDDLLISEDGLQASFDLTNKLDLAKSFVSTVTYYTFPELKEVSFLADAEKFTGLHIETAILNEGIRAGVYTFDIEVAATGEDVVGPVTPTPVISEDEAKLKKLQAALEEMASTPYEATLSVNSWGEIMTFNIYKDAKGAFSADASDATYQNGYYEAEDGTYYQVTYSRKVEGLGKIATTDAKEDTLPNWLMFSSSVYVLTENENEFKISPEISQDSLKAFGFTQGVGNSYELAGTESFTIQLTEDGHVASVHFIADWFDATLTINNIGSATMPFNLDELPLI